MLASLPRTKPFLYTSSERWAPCRDQSHGVGAGGVRGCPRTWRPLYHHLSPLPDLSSEQVLESLFSHPGGAAEAACSVPLGFFTKWQAASGQDHLCLAARRGGAVLQDLSPAREVEGLRLARNLSVCME
ncbi:unnamed protein product [Rangifer tarandus platyrhynchus]|uniref:Uncharacterized protein n=2 Tax=Rangifer tarandus platyrhynchus TaxID=3082113 RepID=A0AC59ZD22_RANTA|nr:unnamed protein product [Rangifer tarandus platyrhynchus]